MLFGVAERAPGAPSQREIIARSSELLDTFGVQAHIDYTDSKNYADVAGVIAALKFIGFKHVRAHNLNPAADLNGQRSYGYLARAGFRFNLICGGDIAGAVARAAAFETTHQGAVASIEGPNEVNNWPIVHRGLTGPAGAQAYQAELYATVKRNAALRNCPVLNFTSWPDYAGEADYANCHCYPKGGKPPAEELAANIASQLAVMPGKPIMVTEIGYHTSLSAPTVGSTGWQGVTEERQAEYTLQLLIEAFRRGVKRTFIYQLFDAYADPAGDDQERHFGLFRFNGTPKAAALSLRSLSRLLETNEYVAIDLERWTITPATGPTAR